MKNVVFSAIIIFVALLVTPALASQTIYQTSTITQTSTLTTEYTATSTSVATISTMQNVTSTQYNTVFTPSPVTDTVGVDFPCHYDAWGFDANKTQVLSGSFNSSLGLSVYVTTLHNFLSSNDACNIYGATYLAHNVTSLQIHYQVPKDDSYFLVFLNYWPTPVRLSLQLLVESYVTKMELVTLYSTTLQLVTSNNTVTSYALETETAAGNPLTSIPGFPWESLVLGCVVGLVILALVRSRKRKSA